MFKLKLPFLHGGIGNQLVESLDAGQFRRFLEMLTTDQLDILAAGCLHLSEETNDVVRAEYRRRNLIMPA